MKETKRALRRHHRRRMLARAMRSLVLSGVAADERREHALRWFEHLKMCSCAMCGNQRKWWGPTVQERRRAYADWPERGGEALPEGGTAEVAAEALPADEAWSRHCRAWHWEGLRRPRM